VLGGARVPLVRLPTEARSMMYTRPFSWCTSAAWEREQLWSRTKSQKLASLHAARHVRTRPPAWILCFIHLWLPAKDVPGLVINLLLAFGLICGDHTDGCCPAGLGRPAWRLERCHAAPRAAGTSRSCFCSSAACALDGTHQLEAPITALSARLRTASDHACFQDTYACIVALVPALIDRCADGLKPTAA
jgi:hypothetical protein